MDIDVFTLFPNWFDWFLAQRHVRNAITLGSTLEAVDYRESTTLSGKSVDDTPFGGGAGMVLRVDVVDWALQARYGIDPVQLRDTRRVVALTPGGRVLDEELVVELAAEPALTLLCGRYEGFDERIVEHFCTDQVSIGRYVLAGGELAAMVVLDAVMRKLRARSVTPRRLTRSPSRTRSRVIRSTRTTPGRGLPRMGGARGSAQRPPRANHRMAQAAEPQTRPGPQVVRYSDAPAPALPAGLFLAMSTVIESLERQQLRRVPRFQAGDRVRVHFQVVEGTRRRTQVFEGVVIKRQGEGVRETFTVRKQSFGVGVERTFPLHSPKIEKIEVAARGDVRRAKLYYLRGRVGKSARVRERRYVGPEEVVQAGLLSDELQGARTRRATRRTSRRWSRKPRSRPVSRSSRRPRPKPAAARRPPPKRLLLRSLPPRRMAPPPA